MTAPLDEKARDAALAAWFANTAQGWHAAIEAAIRAYLATSPSPSEMEFVATELKMTPIADGMPIRDELRGEQTILTYCEQVGTWDIAFMEAGWDDFDRGFALGVSHWLDITSMWPGVISQVAQFAKGDSAQVLRLTEENEALRELAERLKLEAQGHASEARTANSTIYEIYQVLSGGKGEPGNWHGAEPARRYVEAAEARIKALEEALEQIEADCNSTQDHYDRNGPQWTSPDGHEYADMSALLMKCEEIATTACQALKENAL